MKIVALTGPKGSGKDTVAKIIKDTYNANTIAFADPIKDKINHILQLPSDFRDKSAYDAVKRSRLTYDLPGIGTYSVEGRHVVREIGMLMREYDSTQFTTYVESTIRSQPDKLWVVTDLRFDNEYTMLRKLGASVIKIVRPRYDYDGHITERGFDDHLVDGILMNDNSLEFLQIRTEIVMKTLFEELR